MAAVAPAEVESLLPSTVEALEAQGRLVEAETVVAAYRRYVLRRYGAPLVSAHGIEQALADPLAQLPADPLFPLWYAAACELRSPDTMERGRAGLIEVVRLAEAFMGNPRFAARFRDLAVRCRRVARMAPAAPIFSFETSYVLRRPPS
jgi:hypothetical protein